MARPGSAGRKDVLPRYEALVVPMLDALKRLGGSATVDELDRAVSSSLGLTDKQLQIPHGRENDARTELEYRLAWTRTILKTAGLVTNSSRGVWALVDAEVDLGSVDPKLVLKKHRDEYLSRRGGKTKQKTNDAGEGIGATTEDDWTARVLAVVQKIGPDQFERLALRVLREAGFVDLTVTGRVGDGGIDGKGIVRVNGVVSFHVVFQCKRYVGSVSGEQVRAFRGAMEGRADRGLFITSGRFTTTARAEATRDGARPIDLIDGDDFAGMLKQFGLGVKTRMVEATDVDDEWFGRL
jgi:restriction system protein